jgi:hypothetical protein
MWRKIKQRNAPPTAITTDYDKLVQPRHKSPLWGKTMLRVMNGYRKHLTTQRSIVLMRIYRFRANIYYVGIVEMDDRMFLIIE